MKDVTRREFFSELCSKDFFKSILGAWHSFNSEMGKDMKTEISCDEAGFMLGRKFVKAGNNDSRKEG